MRTPSARTVRRALDWYPPLRFAGVRVLEISDDWRHARVVLRRRWYNRNYVGTHFGGSLFAMTDPFWMILVLRSLGDGYIVWDQAAEIRFDAYKGIVLKGHVQSIGVGTGSEFSAIPAQNATGNWVKVTQRVPVRIAIDDKSPRTLIAGLSADVTVFTDGKRH